MPSTTDTTIARNERAARAWHALSADEVVAALGSRADVGLSPDEARARLQRHGPNALPETEGRSGWAVFLAQFKSPLVYLLLVAAAIALVLGHRSDAIVILVVVAINAAIGAFQEGRAEQSLRALRKLASHPARVVRGGEDAVVEARDVVPGDVLLLEAGDAVAADARILESAALQTAEAALTGESVPVPKDAAPVADDVALAERTSMVHSGTHVTSGRARAVVVATALATEIGHIATLAESAEEPPTPLERRIARFGRTIVVVGVVVLALVCVMGFARGLPASEVLMVGISQLVGIIPEGLPVAMTIALAVGVRRMARRRAVVRRLASVETLGSTTVICSDKTGTLTRNEMTVQSVWLADGTSVAVSGIGYEPNGELAVDGRAVDARAREDLRELLEAGVLCNDSQLHAPDERDSRWTPIGDPTEVALVTVASKAGLDPREVRARMPRRGEIPFDPDAKMMATEHAAPSGSRAVLKGAPELVLALCSHARLGTGRVELDAARRRAAQQAAERMAGAALRVLAIGVADGATLDRAAGLGALAGRVTLLGLVGQIDPPRSEAGEAVRRCQDAGIRPVMVTGDHKSTALAVARTLGIAREDDVAVDGSELARMSDAELSRRLDEISVFARVQPAQKLRIVDRYQERHHVVAMTGDGVNDAPALVKANVGVAMGITGTEVAKESADVVVTDDDFATIVAAVEEGRVVYRNIQKAVLLLFSTSAAEVLVLLLALGLGYPPPFAAVQILWNNLVTEGLITVNLVMEPPEGDEMRQPPTPRDEPMLTRTLLARMALIVPAMVVTTLGWFVWRLHAGVPAATVRTETFTLLAICEWFNVLNCRSERRSALTFGVLRNPWLVGGLLVGNLLQVLVVFWAPLGRLFHTVPFDLAQVLQLALVGSFVLWVEEIRKLVVRRRARAAGAAA